METLEVLRHKIDRASELATVVHTVKAIAAAAIAEFETAVRSLGDYDRSIELGLCAGLRSWAGAAPAREAAAPREPEPTIAIVIGSDMGLVGQFNERLAEFAVAALRRRAGETVIWNVGERIRDRLEGAGLVPTRLLATPSSVTGITPLIGELLAPVPLSLAPEKIATLLLFYNRPKSGELYEPVVRQLLPLDAAWQREMAGRAWPSPNRPEVMLGGIQATVEALIREYLFVALFRACAESLASENASRLAAMQRATHNIEELLDHLHRTFHRLRQDSIDSELFDLVAGFEALAS